MEKIVAHTTISPFDNLQLLDVGQVAEILCLSERTVWRYSSAGKIPKPVKLARQVVRWKKADIDAYLTSLKPD